MAGAIKSRARPSLSKTSGLRKRRKEPSPKRAEKVKGETFIRQTQPQAIQAPEVAREASGDKIREERLRNILRDFSKQLAYFWGTLKKQTISCGNHPAVGPVV